MIMTGTGKEAHELHSILTNFTQ